MILGACLLVFALVAVGVVAVRLRQHRRTVAQLDRSLRERLISPAEHGGTDIDGDAAGDEGGEGSRAQC